MVSESDIDVPWPREWRIMFIVIGALAILSLLSIYSYGLFARQAKGEPSQAFALGEPETPLDYAIAPLAEAHAGQTGMVLLANNLDAFSARAITARNAARSLDLQYYIWHNDLTGKMLLYEVLHAADRGVRVRLLLDDLNAHDKDSELAVLDRHPNIEVRLFNPSRGRRNSFLRGLEMLTRGFTLSRRMHNKIWLADGRIAIVGGRNVGNEYFDASDLTNFFDVDLMLFGEAVTETEAIFDAFWNSAAVIPLEALVDADEANLVGLRKVSEEGAALLEEAQPYLQHLREAAGTSKLFQSDRTIYWTSEVHVYSDPPEKVSGDDQDVWLFNYLVPAWGSAEKELLMISPYFVPGENGTQGLRRLQEKGVDVRILTNSLAATDVILVHGGYAPYRRPLLESGIALYELVPDGPQDHSLLGSSGTSLHTKAFMVDGKISFVGSFNFDPRSIKLNTEMGVLFQQPEITRELLEGFASRTSPEYSYRLYLDEGQLCWQDEVSQPPKVWRREPAATFWSRVGARVVQWLPLESQL